jgi:hypothetical protein
MSQVGILPFHGSLLVFISDLAEHSGRVAHLLPNVAKWLEQVAPDYLRWAWLWLIKAKLGHRAALEDLPDRQWMLDSLALGYPVDQVQGILRSAAQSCFSSLKLPRAVELRLLMDRLQYGSSHQFDSPDRMARCTFELNDDKYALETLAANLSTLSIQEIYVVGQQYIAQNRISDAADCQEEIRLRINERIELGGMNNDFYEQSSKAYLDLSASTLSYAPGAVISRWRKRQLRSPGLFEYFLRRLACKKDALQVLELGSHPMPHAMRYAVEGASVRAAAYAGAGVEQDARFRRFNRNPLVGIWCILQGATIPDLKIGRLFLPPRNTVYRPSFDYVQAFFAHYFFYALFEALKVKGNDPVLTNPDCGTREWAKKGLATLNEAAIKSAQSIVSGGFPDASIIYRMMPPMSGFPGHEEYDDFKSLRRALWDITRDLVLLRYSLRQGVKFDDSEFSVIQQAKNFVFDDWAECYLSEGMEMLEPEVAEKIVRSESEKQRNQLSEFGPRAESALLLCDLSLFCGLKNTAREMLVRALRCICGYGQRKDIALAVFMDSLDEVSDSDAAFTSTCLQRIAPIVDTIVETTDGKGTRHTRIQLADFLLRYMPERFPAYLKHLFRDGSWHVTDSVQAKLIRFTKDSPPALRIAAFGVFEEESIKGLQELAGVLDRTVSSNAQDCLDEIATLYGHERESLPVTKNSASSTAEGVPKTERVDISKFGPDQALDLLNYESDPGQIFHRTESLRDWANHWFQAGRGAEVLRYLKDAKDHAALRLDGEKVLDAAYDISLTLEGPKEAYRWLVDSQILNSGWSEFYSEDLAKNRFAIVKKYYLKNWREFLIDSARTKYQEGDSGPFIPTERLVDFLVVIEELQLAREVVAVMLKSLEEDFADQPLTAPRWLDEEVA